MANLEPGPCTTLTQSTTLGAYCSPSNYFNASSISNVIAPFTCSAPTNDLDRPTFFTSEAVKVLLDGARATGWTLRLLTAFYAGGACYGMPLSRSSPADDHCEASATWSGLRPTLVR